MSISEPLEFLARLRAAWPDPGWTWDGRLGCVTSSFASALGSSVRAALAAATLAEWTGDTLPAAPDAVVALADRCGGMRPGQLLLTGEMRDGLLPFALWWPWGDGSKVSVRLGVATLDGEPERGRDITPRLRALFGVS